MATATQIQTLKLIPKGFFSWDYRVLQGEKEIAFIERDTFRERAVFRVQGAPYEARRTSLWKGYFELLRNRSVLAEAKKPSVFKRHFEITAGEARYRLETASIFGRDYRLTQDGQVVGSVRRDGFFARGATADLPAEMDPPLQLFVIFLVTTLWKRAAQAAHS